MLEKLLDCGDSQSMLENCPAVMEMTELSTRVARRCSRIEPLPGVVAHCLKRVLSECCISW